MPQPITLRETALTLALRLHENVGDLRTQRGVDRDRTVVYAETAVRATADRFAAWLEGPVSLHLTIGPVTDEETGRTEPTHQEGTTMQLKAQQRFSFTIAARDRDGNLTALPDVNVTATDSTVALISQDPDTPGTWWVGSGAIGQADVVVTTAPLVEGGEPLTARLAVDVIAGDAVALDIQVGDVEDEPLP
jgi:hypothetical protein